MSSEEKRVWIELLLAIGTYSVYVIVVLALAASGPFADVDYIAPMLWAIGASIAGVIILAVIVGAASPRDAGKADQRDRQIARYGGYTGHWFLVAGALGALLMAFSQWPHFWIANTIYLAFVLSMIASSIAKLVAYRSDVSSTW